MKRRSAQKNEEIHNFISIDEKKGMESMIDELDCQLHPNSIPNCIPNCILLASSRFWFSLCGCWMDFIAFCCRRLRRRGYFNLMDETHFSPSVPIIIKLLWTCVSSSSRLLFSFSPLSISLSLSLASSFCISHNSQYLFFTLPSSYQEFAIHHKHPAKKEAQEAQEAQKRTKKEERRTKRFSLPLFFASF